MNLDVEAPGRQGAGAQESAAADVELLQRRWTGWIDVQKTKSIEAGQSSNFILIMLHKFLPSDVADSRETVVFSGRILDA